MFVGIFLFLEICFILIFSFVIAIKYNWYKQIKYSYKAKSKNFGSNLMFSDSFSNDWDPIEGVWRGSKAITQYDDIMNNLYPFYVFGYGSLIWRPGYILEDLVSYKCQCLNWFRMFSQRSCDHRGTVSFPGLVLTLLHKSFLIDQNLNIELFDDCVGRIWLIPQRDISDILKELDFREKGGYERQLIDIKLLEDTPHHKRGSIAKALVYTAKPNNPNFYLPKAKSLHELNLRIVDIVSVAKGPSGRNIDYLLNLVEHLTENDISDNYLNILASMLKSRIGPWKYKFTNNLNVNSSFEDVSKILNNIRGCGSNECKQLLVSLDNPSLVRKVENIYNNICNESTLDYKDYPWLLANGANSGFITNDGNFYFWGQISDFFKLNRMNRNENITADIMVIPNIRGAAFGHNYLLIVLINSQIVCFGENQECCNRYLNSEVISSEFTIESTNNLAIIRFEVSPKDRKLQDIIKVSAGLRHSAAITDSGEIFTWGENKYRQCISNESWKLGYDSKIIDIECGAKHTIAIDDDGIIFSWGDNKYGQLGRILRNNVTSDDSPAPVEGLDPSIKWTRISSGWFHVVARGVNQGGENVYSIWGRNNFQQCSYLNSDIFYLPVALSRLPNNADIIEVWAGSEFTIVCDEFHYLWGCGWNDHFNLSEHSTDNTKVWYKIKDNYDRQVSLSNVSIGSVAAGGAHILII